MQPLPIVYAKLDMNGMQTHRRARNVPQARKRGRGLERAKFVPRILTHLPELRYALIVRQMNVPCRLLAHPLPATASLAMDLQLVLNAPFALVGFMTDCISRTGGGGDMHADVIYRLKIWIGLCFCILKHLYVGGRGGGCQQS